MLGICYSRILKIQGYNPKNEKGEKDKDKFNYIVTIFDTGLLTPNKSEDVDVTRGDVVELFVKTDNSKILEKLKSFKKYDYIQATFDLQGNFKELIDLSKLV